jgi:hypothetical protein
MVVDKQTSRVVDELESQAPLPFTYRLRFEDGSERVFRVLLDRQTLALRTWPERDPPEWTALDFHRCPGCRLDDATHAHCPVAVALSDVVEAFKDSVSWIPVDVTVECEQRTYQRRTTLQSALSALTGILMPTAGCPVLDRMRPMVETHLPFANQPETTYRFISMFLFAQFSRRRSGEHPDWTLEGLKAYLREVALVNTSFSERLNRIPHKGDANVNAVAILDSLAALTGIRIENGDLSHWVRLFMQHWADGTP